MKKLTLVIKGNKKYFQGNILILPGEGFYHRKEILKRRMKDNIEKIESININLPSKTFFKFEKDKKLIYQTNELVKKLRLKLRLISKRLNEEI